jgi:L-gulono-1,4-lactone dehydrogenase
VLEVLARHPGARVRCRGALHSWSPLAATDGVLLDLGNLDHVDVLPDGSGARVGAGCRLGRLLAELRKRGLTLPTLGVIQRQTVAGATATGTHGSGAPSLSHFVTRVKLAHVDAQGVPQVKVIDSGDELRAARCSLGAMGVVLELDFAVVPRYRVEESIGKSESLSEALDGWREGRGPLSQFALIPWCWVYLVYRRKVSAADGRWLRLKARLCRLWLLLTIDLGLHATLSGLLRARAPGGRVRKFFRFLPRLLVIEPHRVDESEAVLTLNHHWFRHVEMELFVPIARLPAVVPQLRELVEFAAGERDACSPELDAEVQTAGMAADVSGLRGTFTLHYPLVFRRVETDDTLVSMASVRREPGDWVSIGVFSYGGMERGYADFCRTLARCMVKLHGARLHWGKYFPLPLEEVRAGYPRFERYRQVCRAYDPEGRFAYESADGRA